MGKYDKDTYHKLAYPPYIYTITMQQQLPDTDPFGELPGTLSHLEALIECEGCLKTETPKIQQDQV